jgi:glycosyltransferase involved in cell wall biosynthesis
MSKPVVAIVHLGRRGGKGAQRRLESMTRIFAAAGSEVVVVPLQGAHRASAADVARAIGPVLRGDAVPESCAWSPRSLVDTLRKHSPRVVVCETIRAYHPALLDDSWRLVIDFVDQLSTSYRDRARILRPRPRALGYAALSATCARAERRLRALPERVVRVAAGYQEAERLDAHWIPNVVETPDRVARRADHDVLFFGTLSYPPNIAAVERLGRLWPSIVSRRYGTTALIAGAHPTPAVGELARRHGWTLIAEFPNLESVCGRARIAVAPLAHATGLQNKVLEAAAFGLAQVVDPAVLRGLHPGFPVVVANDDQDMIARIVELLDDPEREALGAASRAAVEQTYSVDHWVPWARNMLDTGW